MNDPLKIGVAGLGTVGAGTLKLLAANGDLLAQRCGRAIQTVAVSARDRVRERGVSLEAYQWLDDPVGLAALKDVDVILELIGGENGVAKSLVEASIAAGKHVVTANKALIAHHGTALAVAAEHAGVTLAFEAAVAGGIPIVKAMREGLAANGINRVHGILNGTCNYILTTMRETGRDFDAVLAEAQELGYAEADPAFDVNGVDAAHKLAILASLAFGCSVKFPAVHVEGIRHVSALDIQFAEELGYRIKLLGIAGASEIGIEQRVHPCMVPMDAPISHIEGVYNAVVVDSDFVGTTMYEGKGAGAGPTASAVVADLTDIARGLNVPAFAVPAAKLDNLNPVPMARHRGCYYIRLMVVDRPGVFADVAAAVRDHDVSMEAVLQRRRDPGEAVPVVLTTHETEEAAIKGTMLALEALDAVAERPRMIRIETF